MIVDAYDLLERYAPATDGAWARTTAEQIRRLSHHHSSLQKPRSLRGVESTLVGSTQISSLIPAHIYSTRPWSFHCPHVEWDSGSTFDYWRSRSRHIPIQGHNIWPWVLLCTLLARVRDIETIFAMSRPLGGGGRRGIQWCPKGAHQIRDMFISPLPRS